MTFSRPVTAALAALTLAFACGSVATGAAGVPNDRAAVEHALNRLAFGPRPGEVDTVQRQGLAAWIDEQLDPARLDDRALAARLPPPAAPPASFATPQDARRFGRETVQALAAAKLTRAVHSERQLEEILVDFWFNHFNVFAGKGRTALYIPEYEREAIRPYVFGRFRDMLGATARSPAMLFYLDNWLSADPAAAERAAAARGRRPARQGTAPANAVPQPVRRRGLNENYARELLELHTLGVDGGYTQQDIVNVARAFTGWTIEQPAIGSAVRQAARRRRQGAAASTPGIQELAARAAGTAAFRFAAALHDDGEKLVLGTTLRAGGGLADGERVLDIVAAHPATARHIAGKLARRFVSDAPPAALVERAAARFRETGGDLREVVRAIVQSPEFFADEARRAKVKTPLEFVASAVRATGRGTTNARTMLRALQQLGMAPYMSQPPTGYEDGAEAWISAGALVTRMNVAEQLAGKQAALAIGGPEFQRR
jgi:uncharacterized protein (DUF1800 family)